MLTKDQISFHGHEIKKLIERGEISSPHSYAINLYSILHNKPRKITATTH